eukprot:CAMPEP_0172188156 /NCGR_PEP_ID=MMETSP1050-20130122/21749_1 /TAXON_ID=233186 /ORGANISM="Cryptomonas curvata, Strain CCAP979/52" /LENGTH=1137 /DNA_ID=CAMNT_0012862583 /DNA_START=208 /DNA_END=3617 /DNA_ORIENTATION=+
MAASSQELNAARARQLQADVLVHESYAAASGEASLYASGSSSPSSRSPSPQPSTSASSLSGRSVTEFESMPTQAELETYARLLNSPGQIMPHGVFFLVDESDGLRIVALSTNTQKLFGRTHDDILGTSLLSLFVEKQRIETALTMRDLTLANPVTLGVARLSDDDVRGTVNLILHRSERGLVVDVEELDPSENAFAAHQRVRVAIDRLHHIDKVQAMCELVVEEVFQTTLYDRVMIYKFHEDMHGEVMAERKADCVTDSWLGLHYPATDVPQRIRDLFLANHVRVIVDAKAEAADIVCEGGLDARGIDLSLSTLRKSHVCHLEYLCNMGVCASIGLAVAVREHLWGLVVCHSKTPRFVSYQMRMACEFLAQAFSMRLSNLVDIEHHQRHDSSLQLHARLCDLMYNQGHNPGLRARGLVAGRPNLTDLVPGVTGAAVCFAGRISSAGDVPDAETLARIAAIAQRRWVSTSSTGMKPQSRACDCLSALDPSLDSVADRAAGVLWVPVGDDADSLLMWFRPEVAATIRWGGNPNASVVKKDARLHPRTSFEIYTESVRRKCAPWLKWEVDAATGLGLLVSDILKECDADEVRSQVLARLNDERMQTQGEKEAAQAELHLLIDSVSAPIFGMDPTGAVVQWNAMVASLTGRSKEEVLGRPVSAVVAPSVLPVVVAALRRALQGEATKALEISLLKAPGMGGAGGKHVELLIGTTAKHDSSGTCIGVVFVGQDISATMATKSKQAQLDVQMQQVAQMAAQLQPSGMDATESSFVFHPDNNKDASLLGEGAFGKTYMMRSTMDGEIYAVKMINVKKAEKNGVFVDSLKREVQMLLRLAHQNVTRYFTCYMYKRGKYFCIVMELVDGGTLGDLIADAGRPGAPRVPLSDVRTFLLQMARALTHIHSKRMLHRDLKPHNVLITKDGKEAKITDFGLACVMSSAAAASRAGTLTYASPEKASARGYNAKDDTWALGCIVAELLTGVETGRRCSGGILALNHSLIAAMIAESKAADLKLGTVVEMLLQVDPERRLGAEDLVTLLEPRPDGARLTESDELCEEYMCAICQSLVLDAHTVCTQEHIFCNLCLTQWLANKAECPTCREPAPDPPKRQRIVNNAVEKLAARVFGPEQLEERRATWARVAEA